LLKLIAGSETANAGEVWFDGHRLGNLAPFRRQRLGISIASQTAKLVDSLSVTENVLLPLLSGASILSLCRFKSFSAPHLARAELHCRSIGLGNSLDTIARQLTLSERKMLELACVFVQESRLILLDEPAAGLGARECNRLADVLVEAATKTCLVVVEHSLEFMRRFGARVVVMHHGCVVADGQGNSSEINSKIEEFYFG
jgi:ABC-type branched-subunit amino acid transport system ATPase component